MQSSYLTVQEFQNDFLRVINDKAIYKTYNKINDTNIYDLLIKDVYVQSHDHVTPTHIIFTYIINTFNVVHIIILSPQTTQQFKCLIYINIYKYI